MSDSVATAARPATAPTPDFSDRSDAELFDGVGSASSGRMRRSPSSTGGTRRTCSPCAKAPLPGGGRGDRRRNAPPRVRLRRTVRPLATRQRTAPDAARHLVRAWIGRLVRWVAADHFGDRNNRPHTVTLARIVGCGRTATDRRGRFGPRRARAREIESLTEREQEIAWVVAHGWSPEQGQSRWSQDDLDAIAARFGLTRENLRQVRARLIRQTERAARTARDRHTADR